MSERAPGVSPRPRPAAPPPDAAATPPGPPAAGPAVRTAPPAPETAAPAPETAAPAPETAAPDAPSPEAVAGPAPGREPGRERPGTGARPDGGPARRFWSARRVPSALTAPAVLLLAGALLYDLVAERAGGPATPWRIRLPGAAPQTWRAGDPWVLAAAAVAVLLGACLIVLAVTPGLRTLLPMRAAPGSAVRAGLERSAAALVVRDRAIEVPGVRWARVRVGRRRITVRAESHFRELDDVRRELDEVLADAVRGLGLDRPPRAVLRLRRGQEG